MQPKQRIWDTTTALSADFSKAWDGRLAKADFAHFALRLDWLQWEAKHGRHARAVLVDDGGRRALLVLRRDKRGWHCGWPCWYRKTSCWPRPGPKAPGRCC